MPVAQLPWAHEPSGKTYHPCRPEQDGWVFSDAQFRFRPRRFRAALWMIVLDTCAILFDALAPDRLSAAARDAIEGADAAGELACCDISLWEIAMLADRGRVELGTDVVTFLDLALTARSIQVLPITSEIAMLSVSRCHDRARAADLQAESESQTQKIRRTQ
jgi:PIN domain nuclease of toxin-antitoxin system